MNPYSDIIPDNPAPSNQGAGGTNPYAAIINEGVDNATAAVQANLARAAEVKPDEYARALQVGQEMGLHPDTVMPQLPELEKAQQVKQQQEIAAKTPLDQFLTNEINARIASDDLDKLGFFARQFQLMKTSWDRSALEHELNIIGAAKGAHVATAADEQRATELQQQLAAMPSYQGYEAGLFNFLAPYGQSTKVALPSAVTTGALAGIAGAGASAEVGGIAAPITAAVGFGWGLHHGIGADMAEQAYGQAYLRSEQMKDNAGNPMPEYARQAYSMMNAATAYFLGTLGAGRVSETTVTGAQKIFETTLDELLSRPAIMKAFQNGAGVLVKSGLEGASINALMTTSNMLAEQTARLITPNMDTLVTDPAQLAEFKTQLSNAVVDGLLYFPVMHAAGVTMGLAGDLVRARAAQLDAQALTDLAAGVPESKTRSRSVDTFINFVHSQTDGTQLEDMRIGIDAVMALYQKAGVNPFDLKPEDDPLLGWLPDRDQQLREAMERKGDIVVPSADFLGRLAGTPAFEELLPDIRVRSDGYTLREALDPATYLARTQALADAAQQLSENFNRGLAEDEPMQKVYNDVYSQARKAGEESVVADKVARLFAANSAAVARLYPERYADPFEVYQKMMLGVQGETKQDRTNAFFQAAKRIIYDEKRDLKVTFEDTGVEPSLDDRGQLRKYLESLNPPEIKKLKATSPDDYLNTLKQIVQTIFPKGADFKFRTENGTFDYEHFLKDATRREYIHSLSETLHNEDVKVEFQGEDAKKAYFIKKYFDPEIQRDIWDLAVLHDDELRTKFARSGRRGEGYVESIINRAGKEASPSASPTRNTESASTSPETISKVDAEALKVKQENEGKGFQRPVPFTPERDMEALSTSTELQEKDTSNGPEVKQENNAATSLPEGGYGTGKHLVQLFASKDRSSFLHEVAHIFLEQLAYHAKLPDAPEQVKADWQMLQNWFLKGANAAQGNLIRGWGEYLKPEDRIRALRPSHEKFARAFEQYLMEGKSPSIELQGVFSSFRQWLKSIYEKVAGRGRAFVGLSQAAGEPIELSPEVRGIMDRLLATDDQIEIMRQQQRLGRFFKSAQEAGMTTAEWKAYTDRVSKSVEEARTTVQKKAMAAIEKEKSDEWKAKADELRPEVEKAVNARPDFQALYFLRTGNRLGEEPLENPAKLGIDQKTVEGLIGKDAVKNLPFNILRKKNGVDPQELGEMFGYTSGIDLLNDLLSMEAQRRQYAARGVNPDVRTHAIQDELDARLREHFGDATTDGTLPTEAMGAIHNDQSLQALTMELNALIRQTGKVNPRFGAAADARTWARQMIDDRQVSEVTNLSRYARDEARAASAAEAAMMRRDLPAAIEQKHAQILNHALYMEAQKAAESLDILEKQAAKFGKKRILEGLDQDGLDQIHTLLERFGLKTPDPNAMKRTSLHDWVDRLREDCGDVNVPDSLFNSSLPSSYRELTVSQVRDLNTAIKSIAHVAREAQKILVQGQKVDFKQTTEEMCRTAYANVKPKEVPAERNPGVVQGSTADKARARVYNAKNLLGSFHASLAKIEQELVDRLDGKDSNGIWNQGVWRRIKEARAYESKWRTEMTSTIRELTKAYPKDAQVKLNDFLPPITELLDNRTGAPLRITKSELISLALNWGNESNRSKMCRGEGWRPEAVQAALDRHMTKADWDFTQGIWGAFEKMRPEIAAREKRMTGVEPIWIEPSTVHTPFGDYRGGYYPMIYDPSRSGDAMDRLLENAQRMMDGGKGGRPATDKGYTETRKEGYARPVLLSLDTLPRHIDTVIRDLAWRETIRDMVRIFKDPGIRDAVNRTVGAPMYDQLIPFLKHTINDRVYDPGNEFWSWLARKARLNATIVGLGYRASTMFVHGATALSNSVGEIGAKWMATGVRQFYGSPEKMARMRDYVYSLSDDMRYRMDTVDRDVRDGLRDLTDKEGLVAGWKRYAYYGISCLDMASALPTWLGAFEKARALKEDGGLEMSQEDAVYYADKSVRNAHGGGNPEDLSSFQHSGEFLKLAGMFYTFWNHFYNRQVDIARSGIQAVKNRSVQDFAAVLARSTWYFVMPMIFHAVIKGGRPDDDESWLGWITKEIALGIPAGIPVIRDITNALSTGREYKPTPVVSILEAAWKTGKDINNWYTGEKDVSPKWLRHSLETVGYTFGLPTGQPAQSLQYLWDVWDGEQRPEDLADFAQGLFFPPSQKKK